MISEVVMPQMGADMTEGTIVRWLKHEGDPVQRGEIIAEIETDKANVEIEAFDTGTFRTALHSEGDVVPVGEVIAVVAAPEDDISQYVDGARHRVPTPIREGAPEERQPTGATSPTSRQPETPPRPEPPRNTSAPQAERPPSPAPSAQSESGRIKISPVARRLADERGIDPRRLRGSGPDGRIVRRDVEAAVASTSAPPLAGPVPSRPAPAATAFPMSRMRQTIARRMAQSKRDAPHYYLLIEADMTDAVAFRRQANSVLDEDSRITVNDLIVRACALALQKHPMFNVTADGEVMSQHDGQNVCIGIALDDGLIAPALLDVGAKSLTRIAREAKDLASRAKGGSLRPDELTAGTFTISNLGAYGVEALIAIIQPPQTAILGVGAITTQSAFKDGSVVPRETMKLALSLDHRVTDGAQGAQFLAGIKRLLQQPLLLVLS